MRDGDARYLQRVFNHNQADVLAMVAVAMRACLGFDGGLGTGAAPWPAAECLGLGRVYEEMGDLDAAERAYRLARGRASWRAEARPRCAGGPCRPWPCSSSAGAGTRTPPPSGSVWRRGPGAVGGGPGGAGQVLGAPPARPPARPRDSPPGPPALAGRAPRRPSAPLPGPARDALRERRPRPPGAAGRLLPAPGPPRPEAARPGVTGPPSREAVWRYSVGVIASPPRRARRA